MLILNSVAKASLKCQLFIISTLSFFIVHCRSECTYESVSQWMILNAHIDHRGGIRKILTMSSLYNTIMTSTQCIVIVLDSLYIPYTWLSYLSVFCVYVCLLIINPNSCTKTIVIYQINYLNVSNKTIYIYVSWIQNICQNRNVFLLRL